MKFEIHLKPGKITLFLMLVVAFLITASLIGQYSTYFKGDGHLQGFVPQFNLDREMNIPTWFSSACFLFAALLLWQLGVAAVGVSRKYWRGLSMVFIYLSLDETAAIHETAVEPMRHLFNARGLLYFSWVILGAFFVTVLAILYCRFLLSQPKFTRNLFFFSAGLFIVGTLGMEMIGGRHVEIYGSNNFTYALIANCEESLELIGLVVFLYALMDLLQKRQRTAKHVL
ncbi:MAG: hypothetical protein ABII93_00685 [Chrysiogenia bacterium]